MAVKRVREEGGFGLVELLIAMTVLSIGILAIAAGFSSGMLAINRASRIATAGTLADKQMEAYRALPFTGTSPYPGIGFSSTAIASAGSNSLYTGDAAYVNPGNTDCSSGCTVPADPNCGSQATCQPLQASVTAADGRTWRIDTYIVWACAVGALGGDPSAPSCLISGSAAANPVKKVTVVVRSATSLKTWFRETSTFDSNT